MKNSIDLFDLIKSLEKTEKRYFKLKMKTSDSNLQQNMVLLFDAIDKQNTYNENKIIKKFSDKTFVKRLTVTKARLYNAILRTLEAYHSSTSSDSHFIGMVEQAEILFEKGLFKQAQNLLFTTKKKAVEENRFIVLQRILKTERAHFNKLVVDNSHQNKKNKDLNLTILDQHQNLLNFNRIWVKFHYELINSTMPLTGTKIVDKVLTDYEQKLLKDKALSLSIGANVHWVSLNSFVSSLNGELAKCLEYRLQLVDIFEENPYLIGSYTIAYINQLNNVIFSQYHLKLYNEALSSVSKLENLKNKVNLKLNSKNLLYINVRTHIARITIYRTTCNISLATSYLKHIKAFYLEHSYLMELRNQISFLINIALVYFFNGHYNKTTDACNTILGFDIKKTYTENFLTSNILCLICYMELGIENLFKSVYQSTIRFLTDKKDAYEIAHLIVKHLKYINNIPKKKDVINKWVVFKAELLKASDESKNSKSFIDEIKLIDYIESKIIEKPILKVLSSKIIKLDKQLI